MADTLEINAIEVLNVIADNSSDIKVVAALREAQTALKRLAAIKAQHHRYENFTDGGTTVYPSIHGHILNRLLYSNVDEI